MFFWFSEVGIVGATTLINNAAGDDGGDNKYSAILSCSNFLIYYVSTFEEGLGFGLSFEGFIVAGPICNKMSW